MQIGINMQRSNTQNLCKQKLQCFVLDVSSFSADRDFYIMYCPCENICLVCLAQGKALAGLRN